MSLLDTINHLITEVPVIGGALSLSLAGGVVAAFWKGPGKLKELYLKHFTVSFKLSNAGYNKGVAHYVAFMNWFQKGEFKKYSRSIGFEDGEYGSGGGVGPSKGTHYIWVDGVFYWVTVATPEGRGDSSRIIREVTIGTLGMNTNKLVNLFELFRDKDGDDSIPHIRKFNKEYWERNRPIAKRNWDTVILKKEIKDSLTDAIDEFLASREWYMTRGIPYKLVIVLYGEPGCGKSSIIKSLGHRYQMNIGILNLHQMSDVSLPKAIDSLPKNTLLAIEDFDTVSSVKSRTANHVSEPSEQETNLDDLAAGLNLSTILNTLDGIAELDSQIIFMSTNHPEDLDDALVRSGRVDLMIEIPRLTTVEINQYAKLAFPGEQWCFEGLSDIGGSDVQQILLANKRNPEGFKQGILEKGKQS